MSGLLFEIRGEARNDRAEWALARRDLVHMSRLEREADAAVLQRDAGTGNDDARSETLVVGLDERHHHPAVIRRREADRAAGPRFAMAGITGAIGIDQLRTLAQIRLVEKRLGCQSHRIDVGQMSIDVGQRQFGRLDREMQLTRIVG